MLCRRMQITWIFTVFTLVASVSTNECDDYNLCLEVLKKFTHVEDFHIYTSLKEAETACSEATDAYRCASSAPKKCRNSPDKERNNPVTRGSARLLPDFCGYRAKRRPCCTLRTAFLEHSRCYKGVVKQLNECNEKYRTSLELIMGLKEIRERNEERYCSNKWFAKCVKEVTQKACGKVAAQVFKSYAVKAVQHTKAFYEKNENCRGELFGFQAKSEEFCKQQQFDKCNTKLHFDWKNAPGIHTTEEEKLVSVCRNFQSSFECLNRAFKRCLFNSQRSKLERVEVDDSMERNTACSSNTSLIRKYRRNAKCLSEADPDAKKCTEVFNNPSKYTEHTLPAEFYHRYFCSAFNSLVRCFAVAVQKRCGNRAESVAKQILQMSAYNVLQKCH